ncbi:MAG: FixH family protein, partial [Kangiellaceae bacterium]|nr:FixH family protein [Kangiellaceae bacterium]
SNFEEGFIHRWQSKITNREPLTMDSEVENFFAHNARIRSVHKNMPSAKATPSQDTKERSDMSLLVPSLMKQNAPPDLNINAFKFSREEKLFAHIEVHTDTSTSNSETNDITNVSAVPLNKIHRWRLMVTDLSGNPVENIQFKVEGHMPGHVHGLPTAPRVTHEVEPGVYIVDGMKFQMKGWWVMKFIVESEKNENDSPKHADFFTFNLVL